MERSPVILILLFAVVSFSLPEGTQPVLENTVVPESDDMEPKISLAETHGQAHLAGFSNSKDPSHQADADDVDVAEVDEDDHDELFQDLDADTVDPDLFLLDTQGKRVKAKRDDQYMWAAKAIAKAEIHGDTCKPPTNGKRAPREMRCTTGRRLLGDPAFLAAANMSSRKLLGRLSCGCQGWTQIGVVCFQPCSEHGAYTHDSGFYCHKPCNREGQLALRTGCGLGHDRVCTDGTGGCVNRHLNRLWAAFDVAMFIASLGSSSAITVSMKTAKTVGLKAGLAALKSSLKASAKKLAKRVATKGWVKKQLASQTKSTQEAIMESGATLLLASNLPTDWGSVALEIASAVDPTGVIGFATGFVPPDSCDDSVYFKEPLPAATSGPDVAPLDSVTILGPYANSLVNHADDSGETVHYSEADVKTYCDQTAACLGYYAPANKAYWRGLHAGQRANFWYTGNHGFTVRKKA